MFQCACWWWGFFFSFIVCLLRCFAFVCFATYADRHTANPARALRRRVRSPGFASHQDPSGVLHSNAGGKGWPAPNRCARVMQFARVALHHSPSAKGRAGHTKSAFYQTLFMVATRPVFPATLSEPVPHIGIGSAKNKPPVSSEAERSCAANRAKLSIRCRVGRVRV